MIQKIGDYEVGINGVTSIEKTEHGNEKTTIYKIAYEKGIEYQVNADSTVDIKGQMEMDEIPFINVENEENQEDELLN